MLTSCLWDRDGAGPLAPVVVFGGTFGHLAGTRAPGMVAWDPATELPWLGGAFQSRATGLPNIGFAVELIGGAPLSLPLSAALPMAAPGCTLLASPDLQRTYVAEGTLELVAPLPNSPALVGATFVQQIVSLQLGAGGAVVAASSSNALTATVGVW